MGWHTRRTLRGGGRPPRSWRLAGLSGGKDDRCRLTVVRVVCVEQRRFTNLRNRIGDCFVHTGTHPRFGTQPVAVERKAYLAGGPLDADIEGSRTLRF